MLTLLKYFGLPLVGVAVWATLVFGALRDLERYAVATGKPHRPASQLATGAGVTLTRR